MHADDSALPAPATEALATTPVSLGTTEPVPAPESSGVVQIDLRQVMAALQSEAPQALVSATAALTQVLETDPKNALALLGMGISLARRQQWDASLVYFERAVQADPKMAAAHSNLGNLNRQRGHNKEAAANYHQAIKLQPSLPDAHYNLSVLYDEAGEAALAEESVRRALLFRPSYPEAHNNLGHLLLKSGKVEQAVSHFRQALVWNPMLRPARHNLILALYRLGRSAEAQSEVDRLLAENPNDPYVLRVQAAGLAQQGELEDAQAINQKLLELDPDAADVQLNQAEVMLARNDYEGALACYRDLLSKRNVPPAIGIGAMANVRLAQGNYAEGKVLFQQALMLDARLPQLNLGLARCLLEAGETRQGLEILRKVVALAARSAELHSLLIHSLLLQPDLSTTELAQEMALWRSRHARAAETVAPPVLRPKRDDQALRLGLLVADLERSPTTVTLSAWLSQIDAMQFEVFVYQTTLGGEKARMLQTLVPHWRPVAALGTADLAEQIRQDGIDIVLDLVGHGSASRLQALTERPAPVQVAWLGDFLGLHESCIDAWLADPYLAPADSDDQIPARVLRLPSAFVWQAPADVLPGSTDAPRPANMPFTFGVVSSQSQINAATLDAWAAILLALPEARLVVLSDVAAADDETRQRIGRLLALREVEPQRVTVLARLDSGERLQAMAQFDVVLDTFPKPLGQELMDCLWMGVPVLTLQGQPVWQRVSSSILQQSGLHDWVQTSVPDYIERAIAAARQPELLAELRRQLRGRISQSPAFDAVAFAHAMSDALQTLWRQALEKSGLSVAR